MSVLFSCEKFSSLNLFCFVNIMQPCTGIEDSFHALIAYLFVRFIFITVLMKIIVLMCSLAFTDENDNKFFSCSIKSVVLHCTVHRGWNVSPWKK
jgi:hypothetical protein